MEGGGFVKGTEGQYMMMERYITLGRGHTMQYMDDVSQNCILEIYIILLANVTPIHLIKKKK